MEQKDTKTLLNEYINDGGKIFKGRLKKSPPKSLRKLKKEFRLKRKQLRSFCE